MRHTGTWEPHRVQPVPVLVVVAGLKLFWLGPRPFAPAPGRALDDLINEDVVSESAFHLQLALEATCRSLQHRELLRGRGREKLSVHWDIALLHVASEPRHLRAGGYEPGSPNLGSMGEAATSRDNCKRALAVDGDASPGSARLSMPGNTWRMANVRRLATSTDQTQVR
jgi:hypothetical protein